MWREFLLREDFNYALTETASYSSSECLFRYTFVASSWMISSLSSLAFLPKNSYGRRDYSYVNKFSEGPEFTILTFRTYLSTSLSTLVQRIWFSVKNFFIHMSLYWWLSLFQQQSVDNIYVSTLSVEGEQNQVAEIFNFYWSLKCFSLELYFLSHLRYTLQCASFLKP